MSLGLSLWVGVPGERCSLAVTRKQMAKSSLEAGGLPADAKTSWLCHLGTTVRDSLGPLLPSYGKRQASVLFSRKPNKMEYLLLTETFTFPLT